MRGNRINIFDLRSVTNKKYRANSIEFNMKFNSEVFEKLYSNPFISGNDENIFETYHKCFEELLNFLKNVLVTDERDYVGIKFRLPNSDDGLPFGLHFVELRQVSPTIITDLLLKVQQSNSKFKSTEKLEVVVTIIERSDFVGAPLKKINLSDYAQLCKIKKMSMLVPHDESKYDDGNCLPRALVIGIHWEKYKHDRKKMRTLLNKSNSTLLKRKTNELIKKTFGPDASTNVREKFNLLDVYKFNKVLKSYQITIYDDIRMNKIPIYRSSNKSANKINLFYLSEMQHCFAISNVKGFFGLSHYCQLCEMLYSNKKHDCPSRCSSCYHTPKCVDTIREINLNFRVHCTDCNRYFKNKKCYNNHRKSRVDEKYSVCNQYKVCNRCFVFYDVEQLETLARKKNVEKLHFCGERYCFYCARYVTDPGHYCNIKVYSKKRTKKYMLIFYDLETVQKTSIVKTEAKKTLISLTDQKKVLDKLLETGKEENYYEARQSFYKIEEETQTEFLHEPILVVCQLVCFDCWENTDFERKACTRCGKGTYIFEGKNCVSDFLNLILNYKFDVTKVCCIAHNFKAFDGQFIIQKMLEIPNNDINIVQNGYKILKIELKNYILFIDSLSFLPMPLSKFQQTFSLDEKLTKGFFPFHFLSFSNWNYIGELPAKDQFGLDLKDSKNKRVQQFLKWYDDQPRDNYNLSKECIKYCVNDTTILRQACLKYYKMILDLADINPYLECISLSQLSLTIFRKKFMKRNTLGIIPDNEYHMNTTQSKGCRRWLTYLNYFKCEETEEKYFITPEMKLPELNRIVVDGFCKNYPFEKNKSSFGTVFEFWGCMYHFCEVCYRTAPHKLQDKTVEANMVPGSSKKSNLNSELYSRGILQRQNYHRTMAKIDRIKRAGYNLVSVWEHEFNDFLRKNKELAKKIDEHPFMNYSLLKPRSGCYGGRNESGIVYFRCGPNEKMHLYDYSSLYPYAMLTAKYFIKHPKKILMQKECDSITIDDIMNIDGLAYVTVLCPKNLLWPVLPTRHNKKMYFVCCRTCLTELNVTKKCDHNITERALTGVWSTCELKLAFQQKYTLLKTHELWCYDTESGINAVTISPDDTNITYAELRERLINEEATEVKIDALIKEQKNVYDAINIVQNELKKTEGIFTKYMNTFIKMKAEASGFPFDCVTQAQKEKFIVDFYKENNLILRFENIENNPSKRALAKIMLNSLFGKLIQRERSLNDTILKDPADLQFYLNSDIHEVTDVYFPNNNYVKVSWKYKEDEDRDESEKVSPIHPRKGSSRHVCITSGIQTMANARDSFRDFKAW